MKTKMSPVWVWIVTSLLVILIWGAYWFCITQWGDMTKRGQFGDMFGALNTLFAGFAFAGLVFTIFSQQQQIGETERQQHEDRRLQSEQVRLMTAQVDALREQLRLIQEAGLPALQTIRSTNVGGDLEMRFKSVGGAFVIKNCEVAELQNFKSARFPQGLITPGQPIDITVAATGDTGMANLPRDFSFSLDYITPNRLEGRIRFKVQGTNAIQVLEP